MIWRYHIHKVVLRLPDSWSNWNLEMLVFRERGKPEYPEKNPLGATERTNNKLNPHMASTPEFEPGPNWWEASTLTTAPSLAPLALLVTFFFTYSQFASNFNLPDPRFSNIQPQILVRYFSHF